MAFAWWSSLTAAGHGLLDLLDSAERARLELLDRPADRGRSMVGAAMLRAAVASHTGIAPADVIVDRTCRECGKPHGAPRIVNRGVAAPWVSVSHSGLLVVVGLSARGPVGVDVQRVADLEDPAAVPEWVRHEALFKARSGNPQWEGSVRELEAPLPGYLAAVALPAGDGQDMVIRNWP
jgi:4'-phosphopantetheinyl transferase